MSKSEKSDVMSSQPIEKTLFEKISASSRIGAERVIFTFGAGHPFDLVKTRMQANPSITSAYLLSKDIFKRTGIRGFYVGGIPNFSRSVFKEAYRSPVRGAAKGLFQRYLPESVASKDTVNFCTGISMAGADTFLIAPLERLKVWMMTNYTENRSFSTFFKTVDAPGDLVSSLFRGLKVSFVRSGMSWTSYLVAEEKIRDQVIQFSPRINSTDVANSKIPLSENILIGGLSGIVNSLLTLPFDTVKTRFQMEGSVGKQEILKTLRNVYRESGWKGLYSGWQVRVPHYVIVGVLTAHVIQEVDKIWVSPSLAK